MWAYEHSLNTVDECCEWSDIYVPCTSHNYVCVHACTNACVQNYKMYVLWPY